MPVILLCSYKLCPVECWKAFDHDGWHFRNEDSGWPTTTGTWWTSCGCPSVCLVVWNEKLEFNHLKIFLKLTIVKLFSLSLSLLQRHTQIHTNCYIALLQGISCTSNVLFCTEKRRALTCSGCHVIPMTIDLECTFYFFDNNSIKTEYTKHFKSIAIVFFLLLSLYFI